MFKNHSVKPHVAAALEKERVNRTNDQGPETVMQKRKKKDIFKNHDTKFFISPSS